MNFTNKLNVIGKMSDVYNDDIFDICLLQYQINDIRIFRSTNDCGRGAPFLTCVN